MKKTLVLSTLVLLLTAGAVFADSKPFLGVMLQSIDKKVAEKLDYDGKGVFVQGVVEGSSAEKAGMQDHDVIVEFDDEKVIGPGHLQDLLGFRSPGEKVEIKVWRDGKTHKLSAELGESEGAIEKCKKIMIKCKLEDDDEPKAWLGVKFQVLTDQLGDHFGAGKGVLVSEVLEDSPAEKAGIEAGDVITAVDDQEVEDPGAFPKTVSAKEPGTVVTIGLIRAGETLTKKVELAEQPEEYRKRFHMLPQHFGHCDGPDVGILGKLHKLKCLKLLKSDEGLESLEGLENLEDIEIDFQEIEVEIQGDLEEMKEDIEELREEFNELKESVKK